MNEARFLAIVVESILYAADPSFLQTEERDPDEYVTVLNALKLSNPEAFESMTLSNIELLLDNESAESPFISNIIKLLGTKLEIVNILE